MDRMTTEIQSAYERLERTFERVAHRLGQLQTERDALRQDVENLKATEKSAVDGQKEVQEQLILQTSRLTSVESEVDELRGEIHARDVALTSAQNAYSQLESESKIISSEKESMALQIEQLAQIEVEKGRLLGENSELRQRVEMIAGEGRSMNEEMESRIVTAERERSEISEQLSGIERERDQARATVESMLVRVRQLESNEEELRSSTRRKVEQLNADLQEAMNMASAKEEECRTLVLRHTELETESQLNRKAVALDDEQRVVMIQSIEAALSLVDKHLEHVEAE